MARQINYDAKIEKLETQIASASEKLGAMEDELKTLKKKKEERDYRELLDFMKGNDITAGQAIEALKASEMFHAKLEAVEQGGNQDAQQ